MCVYMFFFFQQSKKYLDKLQVWIIVNGSEIHMIILHILPTFDMYRIFPYFTINVFIIFLFIIIFVIYGVRNNTNIYKIALIINIWNNSLNHTIKNIFDIAIQIRKYLRKWIYVISCIYIYTGMLKITKIKDYFFFFFHIL